MSQKEHLLLKRETAKVGMSVSLVLTVGSAFFLKTRAGKQIHLGAGLALAGFSLWHHLLYDKNDAQLQKTKVQDQQDTTLKE
ncbi:hypothetical protein [Helicobacter monodelphidis]|uniref:hypothetical protein n=1 Tax=Helicobacter sp. 15-1451 TaxID=2004995 RepID=UPI0015EB6B1E|nr:hypothetical protein [Helicobacter sp. 15-1451]